MAVVDSLCEEASWLYINLSFLAHWFC